LADDGIKGAERVANGNTDKSDLLATMRSRFTMAISAYGESREDELDDLRFMAGSPDNQWQWPADVLATRGSVQGQTINARPCLTINKLPQHVRQVTNQQRQNRPAAKVIPADDIADPAVAEVFDGIIKHIEYISDADVAYDTACDNQVTYGEGYIRVLTEYASDDSFDLDLRIGRVRNAFSVYMDPTIQDPCGADAAWCFITQDMLKAEYEREFPGAAPISSILSRGVGDTNLTNWLSENVIRIAEYFYVDHVPAMLNLYPGNLTAFEGTQQDAQLRMQFPQPLRTRKADRKRIMWVKTNGYEVLDEREWPGKYIPVIRVVGNEFEVDGRVYVSGLVRNAKDAQRMYNYWVSQEAEMLALAPKAPFIGYGGQFEGYEQQWKTANTTNWPYLEVNPDVQDGAGNVMPLPQRSQPPMAQTGLIQAKMGAAEDIKAATGQYNASLGQQGNERSGVAIQSRIQEGDTGTYHFVDNLGRAIRHVARQLVDLIPKTYDTQRIARIIGLDGEVGMAKINPSQPEPVRKIVDQAGIVLEKIYNPTIGKYDIVVTTGPSYLTKRQEAVEAMQNILQTSPQLWQVAGDLFIKNMDWPGAQEMAERFKKIIDPKVLASDDKPPELQAAEQQIEALGQQLQDAMGLITNIQTSMEAQELSIKQYEAETKRIAATSASMTFEQIQDIVMGTIAAAAQTGDISSGMPPVRQPTDNQPGQQQADESEPQEEPVEPANDEGTQ